MFKKILKAFIEALIYSIVFAGVLWVLLLITSYYGIFNPPEYFILGMVIGTLIAQFIINLFWRNHDL